MKKSSKNNLILLLILLFIIFIILFSSFISEYNQIIDIKNKYNLSDNDKLYKCYNKENKSYYYQVVNNESLMNCNKFMFVKYKANNLSLKDIYSKYN